ncbi:hypothetical protein HPP92_007514 [Vanilla planifolia]|uniref:Uncharacterized protein n=1 Tax=Vanilla planifolia TaxID=51239 RepID=A0A835RKL1_VANPL|nr:hypothetical protein HPP92_007514 [Vanilla planifolia]
MGRAPCCDKANVKRGPWSPEEDAALRDYVERNGTGGNWIALPQKAGLKRCGKSCRLRWLNYLRPDIKHGGFTEEEDNIIFSLYRNIGSRWSVIASQLPGRTDNDVKNYWNTKLKKKILAATETNTIPLSSNPLAKFQHSSPSPPAPTPPPPLPPFPLIKTEPFSAGDLPPVLFDSAFPYAFEFYPPPPMLQHFPDTILADEAHVVSRGYGLSPLAEDVSAASSSVTMENNGDAAFFPDLGFTSWTDLLGGLSATGPLQSLFS